MKRTGSRNPHDKEWNYGNVIEVLCPIPTRDELRELRDKTARWDAAQKICDEYVEQFEHGDDIRGYMDQMGFLPKHRKPPQRKAAT